jgi:hypothetical protein
MPFHEVSYRLRERGRTGLERAGWLRPPQPFGSFKLLLGSRASAFYRGANRSAADFAARNQPQWIDAAIFEADILCRRHVELLNLGPG